MNIMVGRRNIVNCLKDCAMADDGCLALPKDIGVIGKVMHKLNFCYVFVHVHIYLC